MRTATLLLVVEVAVEDGADLAAAASVAEDRVAHSHLAHGVDARTVYGRTLDMPPAVLAAALEGAHHE